MLSGLPLPCRWDLHACASEAGKGSAPGRKGSKWLQVGG